MKVVLHRSYGGFQLNKLILDELISANVIFSDKSTNWGVFIEKITFPDGVFCESTDDFTFRSHPVFVAIVEKLKNIHDGEKTDLNKLQVCEFNPVFKVRDYYDGLESVFLEDVDVFGFS